MRRKVIAGLAAGIVLLSGCGGRVTSTTVEPVSTSPTTVVTPTTVAPLTTTTEASADTAGAARVVTMSEDQLAELEQGLAEVDELVDDTDQLLDEALPS
jgi:multidrug efflux pump subunit AcrA (membrane-fusion protein)